MSESPCRGNAEPWCSSWIDPTDQALGTVLVRSADHEVLSRFMLVLLNRHCYSQAKSQGYEDEDGLHVGRVIRWARDRVN